MSTSRNDWRTAIFNNSIAAASPATLCCQPVRIGKQRRKAHTQRTLAARCYLSLPQCVQVRGTKSAVARSFAGLFDTCFRPRNTGALIPTTWAVQTTFPRPIGAIHDKCEREEMDSTGNIDSSRGRRGRMFHHARRGSETVSRSSSAEA